MAFLGFDISSYPGDAVMQHLLGSSPYRFCGYYLVAPFHQDGSWRGRWSVLAPMGWGAVVVYVGRQKSSPNLDREHGLKDAADAVSKATGEGFGAGTVIYLDVERTVPMTDAMKQYCAAWIDEVTKQGQFLPGVYCSVHNAIDLQAVATAAAPATRVSFWVAGNTTQFALDAEPAASGVAFADVWQGQLDVPDPFGIVPSKIDVDIALAANPSGATLV